MRTATALLKLFPGARQREEEERDWVQSSRDLLQPMEVGRRFFLVPEWRDDPTPEGRFRIAVNPGMAFGTGVHETTRLCIEALEDYLQPGMTRARCRHRIGDSGAQGRELLGAGNGGGLRYRPGGGGNRGLWFRGVGGRGGGRARWMW